jgi:hypothetical protein
MGVNVKGVASGKGKDSRQGIVKGEGGSELEDGRG